MSCRSINPCHVAIADARVMNSVMIADGSDVAAIVDMPPYMAIATIVTVAIPVAIIIAIVIEPVAIIAGRAK